MERVSIVSPGACQGTGEIPGEGGLWHFEMSLAKGDTWVVSLALWGHLTVPCRSSWDVTWHRGGCQLPQGCSEAGDSPSDTGVLGHPSPVTFGDMVGAGVTTAMAMMLRRDVTWVFPWGTPSARLLRPHPSNEHHLWGTPLWGQSSCVPTPLPGLTGTHSALSPRLHPCHPHPWLG